ncbi:hypothetical protein ACH5RR_040677 [Cinchona calisaya]|uniref:Uncharacterized protein n=1 Tax=Cinchona calisaya TaxID=153742 RepID=A0ABD2XUX9_9GENT
MNKQENIPIKPIENPRVDSREENTASSTQRVSHHGPQVTRTVSKQRSRSVRDWLYVGIPNFKHPDLDYYQGNSDPTDHVVHVSALARLYGYSDAIKCKLFATTLRGLA